MRYDVAVIGGGPSGAVAAAALATAGISTVLIERNLQNIKPCGGAIPLGLIEEFNIPDELIERKLTSMRARSPKGRIIEMQMPNGYVGMVRREKFDSYLRSEAERAGADGCCAPDQISSKSFSGSFDNCTSMAFSLSTMVLLWIP